MKYTEKQNSFDNFVKQRDQLALYKVSNSKDLKGKNRNNSDNYLVMDSVSGSIVSFSLGQALNSDYIKKPGGVKFLKDTLMYLSSGSYHKKCKAFLDAIKDSDIQNAQNPDKFLLKKIEKYFEESRAEEDNDNGFKNWLKYSIKHSRVIYDIAREGVEKSAGAYEKQYIKPEKLINLVQNEYFCDLKDLRSIIEDVIFKKKHDESGKKKKIEDSSDIVNLKTISKILKPEDVDKLVEFIKDKESDFSDNKDFIKDIRGLMVKILKDPKVVPSLGYAKVLNNPNLSNVFNKVIKFKQAKGSDIDYNNNLKVLDAQITVALNQNTDPNLNGLLTKLKNVVNGDNKDLEQLNDIYQLIESDRYRNFPGVKNINESLKECIEGLYKGRLMGDVEFKEQIFDKNGKIQNNASPEDWLSSDLKATDSGITNFFKKLANGFTSSFNVNNRNGENKQTKIAKITIAMIIAITTFIISLLGIVLAPAGSVVAVMSIVGIAASIAFPAATVAATIGSTIGRSSKNIAKNTSKFIENGLDLVGPEVKNTQNIPISRQNSTQSTLESTERSVNSLNNSYIDDYSDESKRDYSETQKNRRLASLTGGGESLYNKSSYRKTPYYAAKEAKENKKTRNILENFENKIKSRKTMSTASSLNS